MSKNKIKRDRSRRMAWTAYDTCVLLRFFKKAPIASEHPGHESGARRRCPSLNPEIDARPKPVASDGGVRQEMRALQSLSLESATWWQAMINKHCDLIIRASLRSSQAVLARSSKEETLSR